MFVQTIRTFIWLSNSYFMLLNEKVYHIPYLQKIQLVLIEMYNDVSRKKFWFGKSSFGKIHKKSFFKNLKEKIFGDILEFKFRHLSK